MPDSPLLLAGFGASTVQGVGDPEGGFLARLNARREVLFPFPVAIHNLGVGGNCTADMLGRVPQLTALEPDLVVVLLGCNDLPRYADGNPGIRQPLEAYSANLMRILDLARAPQSLFISSFPVDVVRTGVSPTLFHQYMTEALRLADLAGYEIWDLYTEMLPTQGKYLAADGLHFGADGHEIIAQGVRDWVLRSSST